MSPRDALEDEGCLSAEDWDKYWIAYYKVEAFKNELKKKYGQDIS
jgi:hypothetical protein